MNPKVSVLMTAYNRERFIAEAIESVLASTYQNFELIIVDDGSSDSTFSIAKAFGDKDRRIRVYQNEMNLGDYPNRNRAASYAKGEYLKYVDSDDRVYTDTLQHMVDSLETFPEAGFALSDIATDFPDPTPRLLTAYEAYACHYFQKPIFFASPGQAIFRKASFESVGGFTENRMVSDFEMWHKMALQFPVLLLPGNHYWVRRHKGQEVTMQNRFILDYERIKVQYLLAMNSPFTKQEATTVFRNRQKTVGKIFFRKLFRLQFSEAIVRAKVFFFYMVRYIKHPIYV